MPGLGRLVAPDARDGAFPMSAHVPAEIAVTRHTWRHGPPLDQGETPRCVAYAWTGWLRSAPIRQQGPKTWPDELYAMAQAVDPWAGHPHDGSTVRAGAKVVGDARYLRSYVWATDVDTVVDFLLTQGPVVLGTNWYRSMFRPDAQGVVTASGAKAGGHAYLAIGADRRRGMVACLNSWGAGWALRGKFYLPLETLETLLDEDGEACAGVETRPPRRANL